MNDGMSVLDDMPGTRKGYDASCDFLSYVVALGLPMGMLSLNIDNSFSTYGARSAIKF
jgi:hypothetical protein